MKTLSIVGVDPSPASTGYAVITIAGPARSGKTVLTAVILRAVILRAVILRALQEAGYNVRYEADDIRLMERMVADLPELTPGRSVELKVVQTDRSQTWPQRELDDVLGSLVDYRDRLESALECGLPTEVATVAPEKLRRFYNLVIDLCRLLGDFEGGSHYVPTDLDPEAIKSVLLDAHSEHDGAAPECHMPDDCLWCQLPESWKRYALGGSAPRSNELLTLPSFEPYSRPTART